jgi:DNA-binding XRE family transcriptional regulator
MSNENGLNKSLFQRVYVDGRKLAKARLWLELPQSDVAKVVGLSRQGLHKIETNKRLSMRSSGNHVIRLMLFYGIRDVEQVISYDFNDPA